MRNQGTVEWHWYSSRVVTLRSVLSPSLPPAMNPGKASLCPALPSKTPGCWSRFGCFWSSPHLTGVYLGASDAHSHTPLLMAHHPFTVAWWMDWITWKQSWKWSCLACIYTLGSFSISILYISLFRWCVNSLYTFFFLRVMCLCICIVLYFSSCSQFLIKIFP